MTITLTFQLTLHSDYHVGAGHRAGPVVDAALLRDHDRAPLVRGTTIAGLLRDGLCDLCELPPATSIPRDQAIARLFGKPERRKRWEYSSARVIDGASIDDRWGAQDVTRVRVNPRTRRADAQKLFQEEEGDARLKFQFQVTCHGANDQDLNDAYLLVAAARMVRHFGSARRRGRGECSITLLKAQGLPQVAPEEWLNTALNQFKARWLDTNGQLSVPAKSSSAEANLSLAGSLRRFRLIARLEEPVLVAQRSEAANAYETMSQIPGATLLGALATRAAQREDIAPEAANAPEDFATLFLRGGVSVSGLFPAQHGVDLYPAIPAPLALYTCENYPAYSDASSDHGAHNYAVREDRPGKCDPLAGCQAKLETFSKPLVLRPVPTQLDVKKREEAHIRMKRETGRVKTGDLYEYIALEAGQWFVGELDCANESCWQLLQKWAGLSENTTQTIRLGKAARRGYGLTTFVLQSLAAEPAPYVLRPLNQRVTSTTEPLTILLLTDAIIIDRWERSYASFDTTWLAEMLGMQPGQIKLLGDFAKARSVDAFNTQRRNPRWRDEALAAGSSGGFIVQHPDWTLDDFRKKLAQIEQEGIGLRRHEGFGRVAFNHPIFAPESDFELGIDLRELPADFTPVRGTHQLAQEEEFRQLWAAQLDQINDWRQIKAECEPIGRLLFLSRLAPLDVVQDRLKEEQLGRAEYLWGKSISAREKDGKINKQHGLSVIQDAVERLRHMPGLTAEKRAIGLEMLAERVAIAAAQDREKEGKQP